MKFGRSVAITFPHMMKKKLVVNSSLSVFTFNKTKYSESGPSLPFNPIYTRLTAFNPPLVAPLVKSTEIGFYSHDGQNDRIVGFWSHDGRNDRIVIFDRRASKMGEIFRRDNYETIGVIFPCEIISPEKKIRISPI